jgi:hypothetical protein
LQGKPVSHAGVEIVAVAMAHNGQGVYQGNTFLAMEASEDHANFFHNLSIWYPRRQYRTSPIPPKIVNTAGVL